MLQYMFAIAFSPYQFVLLVFVQHVDKENKLPQNTLNVDGCMTCLNLRFDLQHLKRKLTFPQTKQMW